MSTHYAMCKYDDATGSYIPLEVRPITDKLKKDDPLYQEGFQAGAVSRDAEIENVQFVSQIHYDANLSLRQRLAAEQAKNVGLRMLLQNLVDSSAVCCAHFKTDHDAAIQGLQDTPSDTYALEAYVTKAGEKMREQCRFSASSNDFYVFSEAIRAIPAVTLEDLK